MSLKLRHSITLMRPVQTMDDEGFLIETDELLAKVKAYREDRHGSETWKNRAQFTKATVLFRIRSIPKIALDTHCTLLADDGRFNILSVENIRDKSLYWEILAEKVGSEEVVSRGES